MLELLLLAIFLSVVLAVLAAGFSLGSRRKEALRRVTQTAGPDRANYSTPAEALSSAVRGTFRKFAFIFPGSGELRGKLIRAGYTTRTAPLTYSSLRVMVLAATPVLAFLVGLAVHGSAKSATLWALVGAVAAALAPPLVLRHQVNERAKRIRTGLPDALDLMVVCIEAGLGLDASMLKVTDELATSHSDVAEEFRVVMQQTNAGVPRVDALRGMAERTGVSAVNSLVATLIQSEKLGSPIGRTLRMHADQLRTKRRQKAEETAAKAPIKMLIPMVLFVLPALFIVVVGPALIVLRDTFSGGLP